ncbi:AI-2E family transporter [Flavobacterium sp. UMI-01]|uniref:AI-2E family transporter n=1 Tax=Flavobacterium sp. UMI-01 TaxID=1441053 RepID=UPI001C7E05DD|nr:AI-2E family transporter [Flavobacterium sp. UMI-01]GIZ07630.1 AI-2E family transporter [Flavobacterium sp. UMI-01]
MITSRLIANGILKAIGFLIISCLGLYFLYQIQTVILYLVISLVLCLIANPFVRFMNNRLKLSQTIASIITLLFFMSLLIGFILLFVPLIIAQAENLSLLDTHLLQNQFLTLENNIENYFNIDPINLEELLKETDISSKINYNYFTDFINSIINLLAGFGMGLASVFFITFFFLKDQLYFKEKAKMILPDDNEEKILNSIAKTNQLLTRYFIGLLIQLTVVFILYLIVLLIFNSKNAFIIAFLCALLNVIPYLGPIIGTLLAAVLTLIGGIGTDFRTEMLPTTIYVIIGFLIVQVIDNNINQPIIFSKSVKSHPLEIFLVILISGILFGVFGMVIAVPIYTILKVVAKEFFPNNKIIAVLTENI